MNDTIHEQLVIRRYDAESSRLGWGLITLFTFGVAFVADEPSLLAFPALFGLMAALKHRDVKNLREAERHYLKYGAQR